MTYDGATPLTAGIVDTGTTLILVASGELLSFPVSYPVVLSPFCFPSDACQAYQTATCATLDPVTGLLMIIPSQYDALQPLTVTAGDTLLFNGALSSCGDCSTK